MKKKRKLNYKFLILLILSIIIIISVFKVNVIKSVFSNLDVEIHHSNSFDLKGSKPTKVHAYIDGVVYYSNNKISLSNYSGQEVWSKVIAYASPLVYMGEDKIYVADSVSGQINTLNTKGEIIWKYNPKYSISNIGEDDGNLIILSQNLSGKSRVNIINGNGEIVSNTMLEDGIALTVRVSNKYREYAVVSINFDNENITCEVSVFDFSGQLLFIKPFDGELVYDICFTNREKLMYISDKSVGHIDKQTMIWKHGLELEPSCINIDEKKNRIYIVNKNELKQIDSNGNTLINVKLDKEFSKIYKKDQYTYLIDSNSFLVLDDLGEIKTKYKHNSEILNFELVKDNIILLSGNKCTVLEYKYVEK